MATKLAQAAVPPPEVLPSGVHGVIIADIDPAKSAPVRATLLERRRPEMYGLLALHRAPTDADATTLPTQLTSRSKAVIHQTCRVNRLEAATERRSRRTAGAVPLRSGPRRRLPTPGGTAGRAV